MEKRIFNKPKLEELKATYSQETDGASENDGDQLIEVSTRDAGGGFYFVLKTDGWAVDNANELSDLLEDFENRLK